MSRQNIRKCASEILWALPLVAAAVFPSATFAQRASAYGPEVREYIAYDAPTIALTHVQVIDGTGGPVLEDRTIIIENNRIAAIGPAATLKPPPSALVLERPGYTVIPGLVGMHNHLFDVPPRAGYSNWTWMPATFTAPRLYLAHGVTSIRTTGSLALNVDLGTKRSIDAGLAPGPRMNVTSPFLTDAQTASSWMWGLRDAEDARRVTRFFAESGAESFKAYQSITRAELAAVLDEAHRHGLKVTGHLCSITYREAAEIGIDNIEHGFDFMTDFTPGKQPDVCPYAPPPARKDPGARKPQAQTAAASKRQLDDDAPPPSGPITAESPAFKSLIELMVKKKVALTSTIQLDEMFRRPEPVTDEYLGYLTTDIRLAYATRRARNEPIFPGAPAGDGDAAIRREVAMERAFVAAGGLLMIGPDAISPDMIKGYADLRGLELLVEGGFTPLEAIKVATHNGAQFLGVLDRLGTVSTGKLADLVLVKGDPARRIADIHNIETVFKDGIGFDPAKLKAAVHGQVGLR